MSGTELFLVFVGFFGFVAGFNAFIRWSERRDAKASVREIQALRDMTEPPQGHS